MTKQKGFTLIEAVVASSIFAVIITSILGVYLSAFQLDKKSRSQRAVAQSARYIMEFMTKELRNGSINYPGYPGGTPNANLLVLDQNNAEEAFYLSGTDLKFEKGGVATNLNPASVKVTKLTFYVKPNGDPYTPSSVYDEHPRVTVVMELTANYGDRPTDAAKLNLQTTFATRIYPGR